MVIIDYQIIKYTIKKIVSLPLKVGGPDPPKIRKKLNTPIILFYRCIKKKILKPFLQQKSEVVIYIIIMQISVCVSLYETFCRVG